MKKQIFYGICLSIGLCLTVNAQNVASTSTRTSGGSSAGNAGNLCTYYGYQAGNVATVGSNTFIGHYTGRLVTTGNANTFMGTYSGYNATTGTSNVFLGQRTGYEINDGSSNVFIGSNTGSATQNGNKNVYVGGAAGSAGSLNNASENVYLGYLSGNLNGGSNNVFLGYGTGSGLTTSNQLFIDNSSDTTPLIWGDFTNDNLVFNGKVGITEESLANQVNLFPTMAGGVNVSAYQLFVKGGILTEAIRVNLKTGTSWADYVFADDYKLAGLDEVECFIEENGHLPNVPSAEDVKRDGIELAEMAKIQQEKIEELTLYLIEMKKEMDTLKSEIKQLKVQKQ